MAVCTVVASHYFTLFDEFFPGHRHFPMNFGIGGPLGVDLFFLISGFVITLTTESRPSAVKFTLLRFVRLYPTFWVCLALTAYVSQFRNELSQPAFTVLANATMEASYLRVKLLDGAYWSLSCELFFYLLIACTLIRPRRLFPHGLTWTLRAWPIAGTLATVAWWFHPATSLHQLMYACAAPFAPMFCLGILLFQRRAGLTVPSKTLTLYILMGSLNELILHGPYVATGFLAIGAYFFMVTQRTTTPWLQNRILQFLGAVSYPLYLLHQNIGYVIIVKSVDTVGPVVSRILAFTVTLTLAWVVHNLIETPVSGALSRFIKHHL